MNLQKLVSDCLETNSIRELYLYKLPVLKGVDNWNLVREIGSIKFKGKHANYFGALVKYRDTVYFISNSLIDALIAYRKWEFKKK